MDSSSPLNGLAVSVPAMHQIFCAVLLLIMTKHVFGCGQACYEVAINLHLSAYECYEYINRMQTKFELMIVNNDWHMFMDHHMFMLGVYC